MFMIIMFLLGSSPFISCIEYELGNLMQQLDALAIKIAAPAAETEEVKKIRDEFGFVAKIYVVCYKIRLKLLKIYESHLAVLADPKTLIQTSETFRGEREKERSGNIKLVEELIEEDEQTIRGINATGEVTSLPLVKKIRLSGARRSIKVLRKLRIFLNEDMLGVIAALEGNERQAAFAGISKRFAREKKRAEKNIQNYKQHEKDIDNMTSQQLLEFAQAYIDSYLSKQSVYSVKK